MLEPREILQRLCIAPLMRSPLTLMQGIQSVRFGTEAPELLSVAPGANFWASSESSVFACCWDENATASSSAELLLDHHLGLRVGGGSIA